MATRDVLAGLDPEQREAAEAVRGPVCILAGAGAGKTRAITHRIAHAVLLGVMAPDAVLAVTFTTRAAAEMRGRLAALGVTGVQARTFHSAALRQVGYFWPRVVGGRAPEVVESKLPLVAEAARALRLRTDRDLLRDLAAEVEWAKSRLVAAEGYPAAAAADGREPPLPADQVGRLYAGYERAKSAANRMDFEDLLLIAAATVEEHAEVAAELRARYRHFVVDEYQDVTPLQERLLLAWLGGRDELCVVGDPGQTIYSFAGASPASLLAFPQRFPAARVVRLVRDYRSTPQVVALANRVLPQGLRLVGQRPDGPEPTFEEFDDEPAEAAAVARRCADLVAGGLAPAELAVLYRVNAQSEAYEQALAAAGVPYQLRGAARFFDRPEVRQAVVLLRAAARAPAGADLATEVRAVLAAAGYTEVPPAGAGAARERWANLAALVRLAEDRAAADPAASLPDLVAELAERAALEQAPPSAGVTLASLHAAKGLEWDVVFLVGLVDGTLPLVHARTPDQLAEERRLLYVGVTRARRVLRLSWALARQPGARRSRRPSRFLDDLRPTSRRRQARRPAAASEPADPAFERLRHWRLERARELGKPAYVIFPDATLAAIARDRPGSTAELAGVPGVGPAKLAAYGAEVLEVLARS